MRRVLSTVALALALGTAATGATYAVVRAHGVAAEHAAYERGTLTTGELPTRGDDGDPSVVATVKAAVPRLLAADAAVGEVHPHAAHQRHGYARWQSEAPYVAHRLATVWTAARVRTRAQDWTRALWRFPVTPADPGYRDTGTRVMRWQGVWTRGDEAFAVFTGYVDHRTPEGWRGDGAGQYRVDLHREHGRWLLDSEDEVAHP